MKKPMTWLVALILTAICITAAPFALDAKPQDVTADPNDRFDEIVRETFFHGLSGDPVAFDQAMKMCEERLAKYPKDAAAMVWHGSGLQVQAGKAFAAGDWRRGMELQQKGTNEMDTAVILNPSVQTLIPRGATLMALGKRITDPARRDAALRKGLADFERVLEQSKANWPKMCVHDRGELLSGLADGWYWLGDQERANAYLNRLITDLPNTRYARTAAAVLKTHPAPASTSLTCQGCHTGAAK